VGCGRPVRGGKTSKAYNRTQLFIEDIRRIYQYICTYTLVLVV
jgi:hypothetical protein